MHANLLTLTSSLFFLSASAASIQPRQPPVELLCLYMTSGPNWTGEAQNLCQVAGQCSWILPDGLKGNVSSAGPSGNNVACFLFDELECAGQRSGAIAFPGYADLNDIGFAGKAQSWRCWRLCGDTVGSTTTAAGSTSSASTSTSSAVQITKTNSLTTSKTVKRAAAESEEVSITTTLSGHQPLATSSSSTSSSTSSSPTPSITTTISTGGPLPPLSDTPAPFDPPTTSAASTISSSSESTGVSITTTLSAPPPPLVAGTSSSFSSVFTVTHTYADGSTIALTGTIVEPGAPTS